MKRINDLPCWDECLFMNYKDAEAYYSNDYGHFMKRGWAGQKQDVYELTQEEWKAAVAKYAHFDWA